MKISELIAELEKAKLLMGDKEIGMSKDEEGNNFLGVSNVEIAALEDGGCFQANDNRLFYVVIFPDR